jgi:hypothetical protein
MRAMNIQAFAPGDAQRNLYTHPADIKSNDILLASTISVAASATHPHCTNPTTVTLSPRMTRQLAGIDSRWAVRSANSQMPHD